ncbi:MAG: DUF2158 domain-containing protein [Phyllobacteriaceae bacterium]|nr:DUF2158 domain-containing protein [Phyllobacteriaceae bacterium]
MTETETPSLPISTGDVVVVKSGGPLLTVASLAGDLASCVWFSAEEDAYRFEELPITVLAAVATEDDDEDEVGANEAEDEDDE